MRKQIAFTRWMLDFKNLHIASLLGNAERWKDYVNDPNISKLMLAEFVWLIDQDMPYRMQNIIDAWHVAIATYRYQPWYARLWCWIHE